MNDQELKDLWRKQKMTAAPPPDARAQIDAMRKKMAQLHGTLKARDLRELVAAAFVVIVFTVYLFKFPYPLTRIGSLIVIGGALFAAWKMIESRRRVPQPDAAAPVAHWLKQERERVHHEAELLRTVFWWYILPLCLGPVVFFWGFPHVTLTAKIAYAGAVALMGAAIYWINQWARRKKLLPLKDELEALLQEESPVGTPQERPPGASPPKRNRSNMIWIILAILFAGLVVTNCGGPDVDPIGRWLLERSIPAGITR